MPQNLSAQRGLPLFSQLDVAAIVPQMRSLIAHNRDAIDDLIASTPPPTWEAVLAPIEEWEDELARAWSPIGHLNGVLNSEPLREAYGECIGLLSDYGTWKGQHEGLFKVYSEIAASPDFEALDRAQRSSIEQALRDFRLAGVALPEGEKARYGDIRKRLSELTTRFSENVLDATNAWTLHIEDAAQLDGLPQTALDGAAQAAERAGKTGYLITLEFPSFYPVLTYCHNAQLRETVYTANCTRASDQGPNAGEWDNGPLIEEILSLRSELATLLGFDSYAALSLATKMADGPDQVLDFLTELAHKSRPQAQAEWQDLVSYAREQHGVDDLKAWDVAYYSELLRQDRYALSQEAIRPYLPVDRVLEGLFEVAARLFGVQISEVDYFDTYHEDARLFDVARDGQHVASFYLDLYARADKRGGAWMDDCRVRRLRPDGLQLPVAYLVCNFTAPVGDAPALLTHNELTTLFHEFGHGLHHMLTEQVVGPVSGINGVAWDAVELPSQFLENWCWEPEALAFISGHHETGEPLPQDLLDKLLAARNFQSAMQMVRQLEFALFDFRLHKEYSGGGTEAVQALLDSVRSEVAVVVPPAFNRFQNSFSHIFAGGYAAGYYSYKWAEVLSADAFSRFEETAVFDPDAGEAFRREILAKGGSEEAMVLFKAFRGREPKVDALLRHSGIGKAA